MLCGRALPPPHNVRTKQHTNRQRTTTEGRVKDRREGTPMQGANDSSGQMTAQLVEQQLRDFRRSVKLDPRVRV